MLVLRVVFGLGFIEKFFLNFFLLRILKYGEIRSCGSCLFCVFVNRFRGEKRDFRMGSGEYFGGSMEFVLVGVLRYRIFLGRRGF